MVKRGEHFKLHFTFTIPRAIQKQADLYFLSVDPFKLLGSMNWLVKESRKYPIEFPYPYSVKKEISVNYPAARFVLRSLPIGGSFIDEDFQYRSSFSSTAPGSVAATEMFAVKNPVIGAQKYPAVKKFFDKIKSASSEKLILTDK